MPFLRVLLHLWLNLLCKVDLSIDKYLKLDLIPEAYSFISGSEKFLRKMFLSYFSSKLLLLSSIKKDVTSRVVGKLI